MKKILVVDDEPEIREIIRFYLEEDGYEVLEAECGKDAIKLAKDLLPDLITLDIMMPEMDGFQVGRVLKDDPRTKSIPIIILSVLEDRHDYRLGIAGYISKPFNKEELLRSVRAVLGRVKKKGEANIILVVDDEPDIVDIIKFYLEEKGCKVTGAYDGLEAMAKVKEVKPSLIILDIKMPGIDGYEVIRRLKRDENFSSIPIIVLTGIKISKRDRELGLKLGATKYLTKPFTPKELIKEIEEVLV